MWILGRGLVSQGSVCALAAPTQLLIRRVSGTGLTITALSGTGPGQVTGPNSSIVGASKQKRFIWDSGVSKMYMLHSQTVFSDRA